jgi:hypothetical protein
MGRIFLGETKDGRRVFIDEKARSTHMHIIGSTGEGKSKFIEHLIREDIIAGNGVCLIDPHGHLYNDLLRWCETKRMLDRARPKKIILFDPSEAEWAFGFNPLQTSTPDISFHVDAMVKAVAKVWGGEDTDRTPLLKRCLRILFHALAEKKLSLLEARHLIDPLDAGIRKYLTKDIQDLTIQQQWNYFNSLKPRPFYEELGSSINRMMEFLSSPIIRNTVGQVEATIDFRKIMDEGHMLLVNLAASDKISDDNARLLGTLIVNDLFMRAKGRPKGSRPFYLYIDECALFINEDIRRILDEGRKFGLHLILAHQHLAQLKKTGEDVYHAVMTDAKTKVIFGGLNTEDARVLAEQVFLGELDLEEAKESLNKPVVVDYIRTWLENYSRGNSSSRGGSTTTGRGGGDSWGHAESRSVTPSKDLFGDDHEVFTTGTNRGSSSSWSESETSSWSEGESESSGRSESLMPLLKEMPSQVFSLEEQIYKAMAIMVDQPMRHAIIKLPKKHSLMVEAPFVEDGYARQERVERFKNQCFNLTSFAHEKALIEAQLQERQLLLEQQAQEAQAPPKDDDQEDFRE